MSIQYLKDSGGRNLGRIETMSDGRMELRDPAGNYKGFYDPKSNITRDAAGNVVATGNMLTTLL